MFLRPRAWASIGYLNLCIWLQERRRRQLGRKLVELDEHVAALASRVCIGGVSHAVQINGRPVSHTCPITILSGQRITGVVLIPDKLVNFLVEITPPNIAIPFVQPAPPTASQQRKRKHRKH